ncbi:MAG: LytTR family DNA-binding domain-containing protein [Bacteroidota bacterium]
MATDNSHKIRCLLVDDEPLAIDVIRAFVQRVEGLEIVGTCINAVQAFEQVQKGGIDLVFLDIQMPKLNGIEFLQTLQNPPKVIFTTAYRDYAIEAFDVDAIDYLLKPISFGRFLKAVRKAMEILQPNASTPPIVPTVQTEESLPIDRQQFIYVKCDKKMVKIYLRAIYYIESLKDYVIIHTKEKRIVTKQKISYLEQKLPDDQFLRIHRSFIIAIEKIEAFSPSAIDIMQQELPIGRSFKSEVQKVLGIN